MRTDIFNTVSYQVPVYFTCHYIRALFTYAGA